MKTNNLKPFQELNHSDKLLRLDWFGGVQSNLYEYDNPLIECIFTPFDQPYPNAGSTTLKHKRSDQFMAGIALGYLPVLCIGQYFRNGKWADLNDWLLPETITFDLDVSDSDSESIIECALSDLQLDPVADFIANRFKNTANCSGIKKLHGTLRSTSNPKIKVIPAKQDVFIHEMELIRFYLTNSTHSCINIFTGAFSKERISTRVVNEIHEKVSFDPQTGAGRFVYRHGYRRDDAPILGRILFDESARALNAAQRVSRKIIADRINAETDWLGYPRTNFPFLGSTRLTLSGRRVKTATGFIFLAYRIHSCSAPFPYKSLSYCDEIAPGGKPAPEDAPFAFDGKRTSDVGPAHDDDLIGESKSDEPPSASSVQIYIEMGKREYLGLSGVPIEKEKRRDCSHRSRNKPVRYLENLLNASTGGGTTGESSTTRQSITEEIVIPSPVTPDLKTFIAVIQGLRKIREDWKITTIIVGTGSESDGEQTSYFPQVACEKFNGIARQFSFTDDAKKERRRFICAQILISKQYIYLFEAQRRLRFPVSPKAPPTYKEILPILLLRKPGYEEIDVADFLPIIEQTVINKTWPDKSDIGEFVKAYTVHGNGVKTVKQMCTRVAKLVGRNVSEE